MGDFLLRREANTTAGSNTKEKAVEIYYLIHMSVDSHWQ